MHFYTSNGGLGSESKRSVIINGQTQRSSRMRGNGKRETPYTKSEKGNNSVFVVENRLNTACATTILSRQNMVRDIQNKSSFIVDADGTNGGGAW